MKKKLTISALLLASATSLAAQEWSVGVGTGAFVFGDFVERSLRPVSENPGPPVTLVLSAATRPGLSVDVEHGFADRWAVRLEGTFTHTALAVKSDDGNNEVSIDSGELDVATFTLPLVFRINTGGSFRFHIMGGPAFAIYKFSGNENSSGIAVFDTTRSKWGAAAGAGVSWHLSDRFAIKGDISDIVTSSPFDREDFASVPGLDIPKPHNVHTTVGLRWKF